MRLHCLQHVPFEGPAAIADWAAARGHTLTFTHLYRGDPLPPLDRFDRLVAMGGPMNIYEEALYPWLAAEKRFIRAAIDAGRSAVGVCLGAQLIADLLGGPVTGGRHKEIGWFPIELTAAGRADPVFGALAARPTLFHWHGDTFAIPPGAAHLARSAACENQAFLYDGRVLGLQFHLEATAASVAEMVAHGGDELVDAPYIQSAAAMLAEGAQHYAALKEALFGLLDRLP